MKSKIKKYDFLIIGSGLIGSLLALKLHQDKYKVLILEKEKFSPKYRGDNRTLAVNANSRDFLLSLGLWNKLKKTTPINKICISSYYDKQELLFDSPNETMGSVIYNKELLLIAHKELKKKKMIKNHIEIKFDQLKSNGPIVINNKKYFFKKKVIVTGKSFRSQIEENNYLFGNNNHTAYVGFFGHTKSHNNIAREIFTEQGPLAVLPAPDTKHYSSTFIFSTKSKMDTKSLKTIILKSFLNNLGDIKIDKTFYEYPIQPYLLKIPKDLSDLIIIGDSLRSIHPVAGQGWNLGVKDIIGLCNHLKNYKISNSKFNKIFYAKRKIESTIYFYFTEGINKIFDKPSFFNSLLGRSSIGVLKNFSFLRKIFILQAMGKTKKF